MRVFLTVLLGSSCLFASPKGMSVISGDVQAPTIDGLTTTIQSGKRAIIHWDAFSIGNGETVRFQQFDANSAILNRVTGFSKSEIHGKLFSNGSVYLINPQGVLIGPNGSVETAAFVASSLDVLNEDFLASSQLHFKGDSDASVVNLGKIKTSKGDLFLVSARVDNQGSLEAPSGKVGLAAGREIWIQPDGAQQIFIRACGLKNEEETALTHSGSIEALCAELSSGSNPYELAIQASGSIEVYEKEEIGGEIFLISKGGRTEVSGSFLAQKGEKGGEIQILGDEVFLDNDARIDVSGEKGEGKILIGGDFRGQNIAVPNASRTFVGENVEIYADATLDGNGGKVVVWADEKTAFFGKISAQGGTFGGDGGFVEVSGKYLNFAGNVSTVAPCGSVGSLYLDPLDLIIGDGVEQQSTVTGADYTFSACCSDAAGIETSALQTLLGTTSVTIDTSSPVGNTCTGAGDIILTSATLSWASPYGLTLIADRDIIINSSVSITGHNLTLVCDQAAGSSVGTGKISLANTTALTVTGEFRIYSASPSLNVITPTTINGAPFTSVGFDNSYEQFGTAYPSGTYIGPEFMFFYKTAGTTLTESIAQDVYNISVSSTSITNLLSPTTVTSSSEVSQGTTTIQVENPTLEETVPPSEMGSYNLCS